MSAPRDLAFAQPGPADRRGPRSQMPDDPDPARDSTLLPPSGLGLWDVTAPYDPGLVLYESAAQSSWHSPPSATYPVFAKLEDDGMYTGMSGLSGLGQKGYPGGYWGGGFHPDWLYVPFDQSIGYGGGLPLVQIGEDITAPSGSVSATSPPQTIVFDHKVEQPPFPASMPIVPSSLTATQSPALDAMLHLGHGPRAVSQVSILSESDDYQAQPIIPVQHPSPSEWESMKPTLKDLYIEKHRPLQELMMNMHLAYGFSGTQNTYKKHFTKWSLKKNQKQPRNAPRIRSADSKSSRRRRKQVGRQAVSHDNILEIMQRLAPVSKHIRSPQLSYQAERVLHVISVVTHGCFDSHGWGFDDEVYFRPHTATYYGVQLEHVRQRLMSTAGVLETPQSRANFISHQSLSALAEPRFDTLHWCLLIIGALSSVSSGPRHRLVLRSVLAHMRGLLKGAPGLQNPMREFFDALYAVNDDHMLEVCRVGFARLALELGSIIGTTNAGTVMFWDSMSEYLGSDLPAAKMNRLLEVLQDRDNRYGRLSYKSMFVLRSVWEQMTASQPSLAAAMEEEMRSRFLDAFATNPITIYDWRASGFRNAIYHRAHAFFDAGELHRFREEYERLLDVLEQGNEECLERALADAEYLMFKLAKATKGQFEERAALEARKLRVAERLAAMRSAERVVEVSAADNDDDDSDSSTEPEPLKWNTVYISNPDRVQKQTPASGSVLHPR